jgi:mono/diheme cytochrome c family protein/uncharacterized membrane protein
MRPRPHSRDRRRTWEGWIDVISVLAAAIAVLPSGASAAQPAGDADAGRGVFAANCAMCHGADATGMMGMHPAPRGAVERLTFEGVDVTIRNGRQTMPPMPAFGDRLSDEDVADIIAYLDTLPSGPRNFGPEMDRDGGPEMDRDGMMRDGGMMERMMGRGGAGPLVAILLLVLLLILIGFVVAVVVNQRGKQSGDQGRRGESARDILDRRYAAGELSPEEYRQARDDVER